MGRYDANRFTTREFPVVLLANHSYRQYKKSSPNGAAKLKVDEKFGDDFLGTLASGMAEAGFKVQGSDVDRGALGRRFFVLDLMVMNEPDGQFVTISIDLAGEWVNPDGKINSSWPSWNGYFKLDRRFLSDRERAVTAARIVPYLGVDQLEKSDNW
jgi:hypothetical protein